MSNSIVKLLHRNSTSGIVATIPVGAIVDIGGTSRSNFLVGGKPVMYADGSNATGEIANSQARTLQHTYDSSTDQNGNTSVLMTLGKDLVFYDTSGLTQLFRINSSNGTVTVSGDLIVNGAMQSVSSTETVSDHLKLSPAGDGIPALAIEPDAGVSFTSDLISVKATFGGPDVFSISAIGCTSVKCLNTTTINSVDFDTFYTDFLSHVAYRNIGSNKHIASEIDVDPTQLTFILPGAITVASVLEFFDNSINIINSDIGQVNNNIQSIHSELNVVNQGLTTNANNISNINASVGVLNTKVQTLEQDVYDIQQAQIAEPKAFSFLQTEPTTIWNIAHNKQNALFVFTLFDLDGVHVLPDESKIIDNNNFRILFTAPQSGRVNMIFL